MNMKNKVLIALLLAIIPLSFSEAFSGSEVNISKNGIANVTGAKVMQLAGPTFYTRLYWGDTFVRLLVKTKSTTKFYRATGEATTLAEVSEGNWLDISGELESGSTGLSLVANTVRNSSVHKEQSTFSGKVTNVDLNTRQFTLDTKTVGQITVVTSTTTIFTKGSRTLDLEHVKVGDTISKTSGDYDLSSKVLVAINVKTFIDPNYYKPKLFEGKLVELTNLTAPSSIKVSVSGVTYLVNLNSSTLILNKLRNSVLLNRFVVGDSIRIFGAIREVDEPIIDAEVVRNTNI